MTDVGLDVSRALAAVASLATELGLHAAAPRIVADRSNLVVQLDGEVPVIARVAMATSLVRIGMAWLRREVDITRFLDARGAAVTRPASRIDCGPHERAGYIISFWEVERIAEERVDPADAGAALARVHGLLREFAGELPVWGGFEEARLVLGRARERSLMSSSELARVERAWDAAERVVEGARARTASFQALHGDAHIGNVLATDRGAVWTDWEDAFLGPVELDIACLRSRADLFGEDREAIDRMTAAYGGGFDPDLARDLGLVRNVQVIPWLAVFAERDSSLLPRMRARIAKLG
jgi:hypothetical protein